MRLSKKHRGFRTGIFPVLVFIFISAACVTPPFESALPVWESLPADEDVYLSIEAESGMQLFGALLETAPAMRGLENLINQTDTLYLSLSTSAYGSPLFNIVADGSYPAAGLEWALAFSAEWQRYRGYRHRWIHKPTGIELTVDGSRRLYISNVGNDHLYLFPERDRPRLPDETLGYFESRALVGYFADPGSPLLSVMPLFDKLPIEYFTAILDADAAAIIDADVTAMQLELDIRLMNRTAAIITRNLLTAGMKQLNSQGGAIFFTDIEASAEEDHLYLKLSGIESSVFRAAIEKTIDGFTE